jgi:hypothetical protein
MITLFIRGLRPHIFLDSFIRDVLNILEHSILINNNLNERPF